MKHKFCGWIGAFILACGLVHPDRAVAFSGNLEETAYLGYCPVTSYVMGAIPLAEVSIGSAHPNGTRFFTGGQESLLSQITAGLIAECLSVTPGLVTNFTSNGANGTFQTDDYIGFSFTYDGYNYEYAISGATNT